MKEVVVKVIDQEEQVLFQCPIEERERAFEFAREMESLDINIRLIEPSLPETLAQKLGMSASEKEDLCRSIEKELEEHN